MSNRALLEAAARAAGYTMHIVSGWERDGTVTFYMEPSMLYWNPLLDDGDAFRLAVKLGMFEDSNRAHVELMWQLSATRDADPAAATRRAIVRAAAALAPPA